MAESKSGGDKPNQQRRPSRPTTSDGSTVGRQKSNPTNNNGDIRSNTTTGSTGPKTKTGKE